MNPTEQIETFLPVNIPTTGKYYTGFADNRLPTDVANRTLTINGSECHVRISNPETGRLIHSYTIKSDDPTVRHYACNPLNSKN